MSVFFNKTIYFICILFFVIKVNGQSIGNKVSFLGKDGKTYSGVIKEINNNKFRVKYDDYDFEAWLTKEQFRVIENPVSESSINNQNWKVGDKVEVYSIWDDKWLGATI